MERKGLRRKIPKPYRLSHCERSVIDEKKVLFRLNRLSDLGMTPYCIQLTSRVVRDRFWGRFDDTAILGYLAGVPKLVYGENPLVKLGKFYPILPKDFPHTPTSALPLGSPKWWYHQINPKTCPALPWRWAV